MEKVIITHPIRDIMAVSFFNLLQNLNVGFTLSVSYLSSFFTILALAFLINELTYLFRFGGRRRGRRRRIAIAQRIALSLNKFQNKKLSAIGLFVLFVHLFLWLTQLFFTNNIKTNKVVRMASQSV